MSQPYLVRTANDPPQIQHGAGDYYDHPHQPPTQSHPQSQPQPQHRLQPTDGGSNLPTPPSYTVARPPVILETEGVVSSEVGNVPNILHQELHPDGQPRRPMNAFMIFARHRRSAIQAKEPGLKTGDISKRLSHDWKNLPETDKSHYLDQAKILKDEFHARFPDYVYKRRPNNTAKGRPKSSASQQNLSKPSYSVPSLGSSNSPTPDNGPTLPHFSTIAGPPLDPYQPRSTPRDQPHPHHGGAPGSPDIAAQHPANEHQSRPYPTYQQQGPHHQQPGPPGSPYNVPRSPQSPYVRLPHPPTTQAPQQQVPPYWYADQYQKSQTMPSAAKHPSGPPQNQNSARPPFYNSWSSENALPSPASSAPSSQASFPPHHNHQQQQQHQRTMSYSGPAGYHHAGSPPPDRNRQASAPSLAPLPGSGMSVGVGLPPLSPVAYSYNHSSEGGESGYGGGGGSGSPATAGFPSAGGYGGGDGYRHSGGHQQDGHGQMASTRTHMSQTPYTHPPSRTLLP